MVGSVRECIARRATARADGDGVSLDTDVGSANRIPVSSNVSRNAVMRGFFAGPS